MHLLGRQDAVLAVGEAAFCDRSVVLGLVGSPGKARMDATPLGRYGKPSDIAFGCLYLASDETAWMTGSELVIDGGMTAN